MPFSDNLVRVPPQEVAGMWDRVSTPIKAALAHDPFRRLTSADVLTALTRDQMELWLAGDAVGVTQLIQHPHRRECRVVCVSGSLEDWFSFVPLVEAWARSMGCDFITCDGRKGWARKMLEHGWNLETALVGRSLA